MLYLKINKLHETTKFRDWLSSNDLFVVIKYGNQVRRTTVKWNNNSPIWNESFVFEENQEKTLILGIYDEDAYSKSDKVQEYAINVKKGEIKKYKTKYLEVEMGSMVRESELKEKDNVISDKNLTISQQKKHIINLETALEEFKEKGNTVKDYLEKALDSLIREAS